MPDERVSADKSDWENVLDRFEEAWRKGPGGPQMEEFLPPANNPLRAGLLKDLIKIDLDHRWRSSVPAGPRPGPPHAIAGTVQGPRLEQYLERYPELRRAELLLELIGEEYRVRHCW